MAPTSAQPAGACPSAQEGSYVCWGEIRGRRCAATRASARRSSDLKKTAEMLTLHPSREAAAIDMRLP
eukprot:scaffold156478_cov28-Tisochrysis_lutea.AAC.6